ncbi:DUF4382 domain-containing protein [Marinobacter sp.]|uniref:DUF4382 domain-containing protein n=1 Tax=Marinobacter sp. TaxID=50741 RepID=UPI00356885BE
MNHALIKGFAINALAAAVAACGGGDSGSDDSATGTASFGLTDAAVDSVQEVNITVVGVELHSGEGDRIGFEVENPEKLGNINLLDLQNGSVETLLTDQELPAGGSASFTIDFDVRKSLINPPGLENYLLKPVLRLVDNTEPPPCAGAFQRAPARSSA